jgi:maleylacetoacetate isomerase
MKLYNFHRSSASYRVRIALALKGVEYEYVPIKLSVDPQSEQLRPDYAALNPQRMVPLLEDGPVRISQTLAIIDYLDRRWPEPPLYPADDAGRSRVMSIAAYIASEIQPLPCLRVELHLRDAFGFDRQKLSAWRTHWIDVGFSAVEQMLSSPDTGRFCHGDQPTAADCYLVPQVSNARRARVDLTPYPNIARIVAACLELPAFSGTVAEAMPDHEPMTAH